MLPSPPSRPVAVLFVACCLLAIGSAEAADRPPAELLWPAGAPGALGTEPKDQPSWFLYQAEQGQANGTAVVICPGGGYGHLAMNHEGHQVAEWLNTLGVTAMVCDYRHRGKGYGHPAPLLDAQRAIRLARSRADSLHLRPDRIGILGFSAGGHLASTAATHFDSGNASANDPVDRVSSRPDFAILCYPVITLTSPITHVGSKRNLLGVDPDPKLVRSLSSETQVGRESPPTFIYHTSEDTGVSPLNSLMFYSALQRARVPVELHIYERGRHGLGLAAHTPGASDWPVRCAAWMRTRGLLTRD